MGLKTARTALLFLLAVSCAANAEAGEGREKQGAGEMLGEARVFNEAMTWFRKAEAMIGTPAENGDEQLELFRKAVDIKPDFLEAHYNLGLVHLNRKEMAEAAAALETVLRIDPQFDPQVYRLLATAYRGAGDRAAAIAALETGMARRPDDMEMLAALAYLELESGREEAAAENLEKVLERQPGDAALRFDLALLCQKRGDGERAAAHYRELLARVPDHFGARFNLGMLLLGGGKLAEGTAQLEEAAKLNPEDAQVRERLGDAYSLMQQYEKAAANYRAALARGETRVHIRARLGFALAKLGLTGEAIEVLEGAGPGGMAPTSISSWGTSTGTRGDTRRHLPPTPVRSRRTRARRRSITTWGPFWRSGSGSRRPAPRCGARSNSIRATRRHGPTSRGWRSGWGSTGRGSRPTRR